MPRNELRDPPTPIAAGLWLAKLSQPLVDIQDLETESYHPKDYHKVDQVHDKIMEIEETKPAIFRVENPDTRWDDDPETAWVAHLRHHFGGLHGFMRVLLHRPYIFNRQKSRLEALKACIIVLEMGGKMFQGLPPDHWRKYVVSLLYCFFLLFLSFVFEKSLQTDATDSPSSAVIVCSLEPLMHWF